LRLAVFIRMTFFKTGTGINLCFLCRKKRIDKMVKTPASTFDFSSLVENYDRWYGTPAGNTYDREEKSAVLQFLPSAEPGDRLLDVGCGTGHWSRFFSSQGYEVVGVDISLSMIRNARSKCLEKTSLMVANASSLPFEKASFNIVTAMATLEFISNIESAVAEMLRCTKPDGKVIIGTLNKLAPINRDRVVRNKEPYASAHLFSPDELRHLLALFGPVRIRVSVNESKNTRMKPLKEVWDKYALPWNQPAGAFIVAEVPR